VPRPRSADAREGHRGPTKTGRWLLAGTLIETNGFGTVIGPTLSACGVGLLLKRRQRAAALTLGTVLLAYSLLFEVPKYIAVPSNMSLRTQV
jgi:hypothetical protein